jgi:uracil-DNA glycosylase family 4
MNIRKDAINVKCIEDHCPHFLNCCKIVTEVVYARDSDNIIDVMIVGMGAGKDDSEKQRPFTGMSGKYLRSLIKHMWNDKLFNIALSNTVRCWPSIKTLTVDKKVIVKDREPTKEEINFCISNLWKDIQYLKPKSIVTVGKSATSSVAQIVTSATMSSIRGKRYTARGYDIVATWHPAYLTRIHGVFNAVEKQKEDLEMIEDITTAINFQPITSQTSLDL